MPELTFTYGVILFLTGIIAGVSNAVAGGGTFFTFPALLASGLPPVIANASNSLAVWPGHVLALVGYRKELAGYSHTIRGSIAVALVGGAAGAVLLATVGNQAFSKLIPPLILLATLLFALGGKINRWLRERTVSADFSRPKLPTRFLELLFALYGGFFGAGLGVMVMAGLQMLGVTDPHANNALKNLLAAVVNTASIVVLVATGLVAWPHTALAFSGAVFGGLIGGHVARRIPAQVCVASSLHSALALPSITSTSTTSDTGHFGAVRGYCCADEHHMAVNGPAEIGEPPLTHASVGGIGSAASVRAHDEQAFGIKNSQVVD